MWELASFRASTLPPFLPSFPLVCHSLRLPNWLTFHAQQRSLLSDVKIMRLYLWFANWFALIHVSASRLGLHFRLHWSVLPPAPENYLRLTTVRPSRALCRYYIDWHSNWSLLLGPFLQTAQGNSGDLSRNRKVEAYEPETNVVTYITHSIWLLIAIIFAWFTRSSLSSTWFLFI